MDRAQLEAWIDRYEQVWRTPDTSDLVTLFADDVSYRPSPWDEPVRGLAALATFWEAQRDGPQEQFQMTSETVAVDGHTGVARVEVAYGNGDRWRDIWIVRLLDDGRCRDFEEWPIAPRR
jgi:ketosteroid isomerase-like protein